MEGKKATYIETQVANKETTSTLLTTETLAEVPATLDRRRDENTAEDVVVKLALDGVSFLRGVHEDHGCLRDVSIAESEKGGEEDAPAISPVGSWKG
jgi:hypothetical protein